MTVRDSCSFVQRVSDNHTFVFISVSSSSLPNSREYQRGQPHSRLHFRLLLLPTQFQRVSKRTTTQLSSFPSPPPPYPIPESIEEDNHTVVFISVPYSSPCTQFQRVSKSTTTQRLHFRLLLLLPTQFQRQSKRTTTHSSSFPPPYPIPKSIEEENHTFVFPSFFSSSQSRSIPRSIKKAYKTGHICTSHKRWWVVYLDPLSDCRAHRINLFHCYTDTVTIPSQHYLQPALRSSADTRTHRC